MSTRIAWGCGARTRQRAGPGVTASQPPELQASLDLTTWRLRTQPGSDRGKVRPETMGAECGGRSSPRPYLNSGMSFPSRHGTAAGGASHSRAPIRLPQGLPRGASGFTPSQGRRGSLFSPASFLGSHLPSSGCLQWAPTSGQTAVEPGGVGVGVGSTPSPALELAEFPQPPAAQSCPVTIQTSNPSAP